MNERSRENLSRVRKRKAVRKQEGIWSCDQTHVRNNFLVSINTYVIEEIRNYQDILERYVKKEMNKIE